MIPPADPLSGDVLTFVDLAAGPPDDAAAIRSHRVVVGVGGPPTPGLTAVCDEADVEVIRANVAANPRAAYTLAGLLRIACADTSGDEQGLVLGDAALGVGLGQERQVPVLCRDRHPRRCDEHHHTVHAEPQQEPDEDGEGGQISARYG